MPPQRGLPSIERRVSLYAMLCLYTYTIYCADTHELPCHSWNLIGPLVVSALKLGIVWPRRILKTLLGLVCLSLENSRVEAQLLTECLSQAETSFIRSVRPAKRVSDRDGAMQQSRERGLLSSVSHLIKCELISQTRFGQRVLCMCCIHTYTQLFVSLNCLCI